MVTSSTSVVIVFTGLGALSKMLVELRKSECLRTRVSSDDGEISNFSCVRSSETS